MVRRPDGQQVLDGDAAAAAVVGVDVGQEPVAARRSAREHRRDPGRGEQVGQRVAGVQRHQHDAVDVALGDVPLDLRPFARALDHQQHQLQLGVGDSRRDAADHRGEERVGEDPVLGLGEHDRDGVGLPGDQAAGRPVGHVAQRRDDPLDGRPRGRADPGRAVDDARHRRGGHPCLAGDLAERRPVRCADGLAVGGADRSGAPEVPERPDTVDIVPGPPVRSREQCKRSHDEGKDRSVRHRKASCRGRAFWPVPLASATKW